MHLWVDTLLVSMCISKLVGSLPADTSLRVHDHSAVRLRRSHSIWIEWMRKNRSGFRHIRRGWKDIKGYLAVRNHTNWVDQWILRKSAWDNEQGQIDCMLYNEKMSFYHVVYQIYIPSCSVHYHDTFIWVYPVAQLVSVIPVSLYPPCWLPHAELNGSDSEKKILLPQWPSSASLSSFNWHLQMLLWLHSSTICSEIVGKYIYGETVIMYAIWWCSKSCNCKEDEYDRQNALWLWNPKHHHSKNMAPSFRHSWAEVSAAHEVSHYPMKRFQLLTKSPAGLRWGLSCSWIWLSYKARIGAPGSAFAESESSVCSSRGTRKHLEVLRSTGEVNWSKGSYMFDLHTDLHCADIWNLDKIVWDQEQGKI